MTDIQRAARFYYLQQPAFGARVEGQSYGTATTTPPSLNLLRLEENLSTAHLRLSRTYIEHLSWQECLTKYDREHTLYGPAVLADRGLRRAVQVRAVPENGRAPQDLKGKAIISLKDHPDIRQCFAGFHIEATDIKYTVGGGKGREAREVLIFSWDIQREPAGLF